MTGLRSVTVSGRVTTARPLAESKCRVVSDEASSIRNHNPTVESPSRRNLIKPTFVTYTAWAFLYRCHERQDGWHYLDMDI